MVPRIPLAKEEEQYILSHMEDGPGRIAHVLSTDPDYAQLNGGNRKRKTVESFIYREKNRTETILKLELPATVVKQAWKKGISKDQMRFVALRAILQRVKVGGDSSGQVTSISPEEV